MKTFKEAKGSFFAKLATNEKQTKRYKRFDIFFIVVHNMICIVDLTTSASPSLQVGGGFNNGLLLITCRR